MRHVKYQENATNNMAKKKNQLTDTITEMRSMLGIVGKQIHCK